ncbi:MAG: exodeoxyribonuclease VII small subunit [Coriobacteriales bacterium]|nr:exodeoxyribonuclease VII small subunit [Coriobacteriales bacterium]
MSDGAERDSRPLEGLSFREGSEELEAIVRQLEGNQLELEESLKLYERGVRLLRQLQGQLDTAQQKVTVLMGELEASEDGNGSGSGAAAGLGADGSGSGSGGSGAGTSPEEAGLS